MIWVKFTTQGKGIETGQMDTERERERKRIRVQFLWLTRKVVMNRKHRLNHQKKQD